jgi:tripartite-type tricarboxylate transporter receptor subunit TctC
MLVLCGLCAPFASSAADYPSRPVRVIVGFLPGSSNDMLARYVGAKLTDRLGKQVLVDNRPGAAGMIGNDIAAKATPDGHTLLVTSVSYTMLAAVQKLPYDPLKALVPVATLGRGPLVLATSPSLPAASVKGLVELAQAKPNALAYATAGVGNINHFSAALFARSTGIQMTHVPYKGGAPALADVMAGQVQMMFATMPLSLPQIRAGKLRALGVTSAKRAPVLPEVPSIAESGVPGYEVTTWWGVLAPAGVPAPIAARLHGEIGAVLGHPDSAQRLAGEGAEPWQMTSAAFGRLIVSEIEKWTRVAREANIRAE